MARADAYALLSGAGIPVIHGFYVDGEERLFPVVAYSFEGVEDFHADGRVWARFDRWSASLYMEEYDDSLVGSVEAVFDAAGVVARPHKPEHDREEGLWRQEWTFTLIR